MKKTLALALSLLLAFSLYSCGKNPEQDSDESSSTQPQSSEEISSEPATDSESSEENMENPENEGPIVIADASKYRGTLVSVSDDGKTIKLEQVSGTDFGAADMEFTITDDTQTSFDLTQIPFEEGAYYEVYYGKDEDADKTDAIAINFLAEDPTFVLTNCVVTSIDTENSYFLAKKMDNDEEIRFNYMDDGNTQFYMDINDIKEGAELTVYHRPFSTNSLPPQFFALEVSAYKG